MNRSAAVLPFRSRVLDRRDSKVRNGVIVLQGADVPDDLFEEIASLVARCLFETDTDCLVSGADDDCYDYFDAECE